MKYCGKWKTLLAWGSLLLGAKVSAISTGVSIPIMGALDDGTPGPYYWADLPQDVPFSGILEPAFKTMTTGGDNDSIATWQSSQEPPTTKFKLANGFTGGFVIDGEAYVAFGADFLNGSPRTVSFRYFQDSNFATAGNTFSGSEKVGDLLVIVHSNGIAVDLLRVFKWVGIGGNAGGGTYQLLHEAFTANAATCDVGPHKDKACATVNTGPIPAEWPYVSDTGLANMFAPGSFLHGVLNLTKLYGSNPPCFNRFMVGLRSSTDLITGQLGDFVVGGFKSCGLSVSQECTAGDVNVNQTSFVYSYTLALFNKGLGTLFNMSFFDGLQNYLLADLPGRGHASSQQVFASPLNPGNYTLTVTASTQPASGGYEQSVITIGPNFEECPEVERAGALAVTLTCTPEFINKGGRYGVGLRVAGTVCNPTNGANAIDIENVQVSNSHGTPSGVVADRNFTLPILHAGECSSFDITYPTHVDASLTFFDVAVATGTARLGFGSVTTQSNASCAVCSH